MKWLLIVLLVFSVLVSGCNSNKTGYVCPTCEGEVASTAPACPHCGQVFSLRVAPISISKNNTIEKDESSGSVQIHFPIEYRDQRWEIKITSEGKEIYKINDLQDDGLSKLDPISISLPPGRYEYVLNRPPYFSETGEFVVTRGATIIVSGEDWTTSDLQELGLDDYGGPKDPDTSQ
jgi:hypothetical protein